MSRNMPTFTDILIRYEAGDLSRTQALQELVHFGLSEDDAEEALEIAEETHDFYSPIGRSEATSGS